MYVSEPPGPSFFQDSLSVLNVKTEGLDASWFYSPVTEHKPVLRALYISPAVFVARQIYVV
jgi:hypothetical protein